MLNMENMLKIPSKPKRQKPPPVGEGVGGILPLASNSGGEISFTVYNALDRCIVTLGSELTVFNIPPYKADDKQHRP